MCLKNKNKKDKVFPANVFNYEVANHVPDDRDSVYSPELEERLGGQIFVSEDKIRDIVKQELDKRFGKNKEEADI